MSGGRCLSDTDRIRHYRADRDSGYPRGRHGEVEVRYDTDACTTIDEICTTQLHLEMDDTDSAYMILNGLRVTIWAVKRGVLSITAEPESCTPFTVAPGEGTLERSR